MTDKDIIHERGRSLEDDYFRKKDQELIEKLRAAAAAERTKAELGEARAALSQNAGITDPELLTELEALGFTPDTVVLLPLVPVVQMAWAEGGVSGAERYLIVQIARSRGIDPGSAADQKLSEWLAARPAARVFTGATRLISAMLASPGAPGAQNLTADELVKHCESIAAASGGILGVNRISGDERRLLIELAAQLKSK